MNVELLKVKNEGYLSGYYDDGQECPYQEGLEEEFYWLSGKNEALDDYSRGFDI